MTWAMDTDDFRGECKGGKYPLLRKINNVLYEHVREKFLKNNTKTETRENLDRLRSDGRCGSKFPLTDGSPAQCNLKGKDPCCSEDGYCGKDCECDKCIDYRNGKNLDFMHSSLLRSDLGTSIDLKSVDQVTTNQTWLF